MYKDFFAWAKCVKEGGWVTDNYNRPPPVLIKEGGSEPPLN